MTLRVGEVRVYPAPTRERRCGLLAWVSAEVNGLVLDGITLRKARSGQPCLTIPKRRDSEGRLHPWFLPVDQRDREALEDQILGAIDLEELAR